MGEARSLAVTGAAGYVGSRVLKALEADASLHTLLALDTRPPAGPPARATFLAHDVTQPLDGLFKEHRVDTVIHLAFVLKPGRNARERAEAWRVNVGGMENVLRACIATGVRRFMYFSSHTVYGAHPDNGVPLAEDAPMRPNRGFQYGVHKAEAEAVLQQFTASNPQVTVTVLRSCVVMGPKASNFVTQALFKPFLVGVLGCDPPMQFVHEEDVARLMHRMVVEPMPGIFNVAGEGTLRYSEMVRASGRKLYWLPAPVIYPLTQLAWWLGVQKDSPAVGLDNIRYPMVVSTDKLKAATAFSFKHSSREALASFVAGAR
jgi:UDP-glucose 4-epimerase